MRRWYTYNNFEEMRDALLHHECHYDSGFNRIASCDTDGFRFGFCCLRCETAFQFPYKESANDPRFATPELRVQLAAELHEEVEQRREQEPTYLEQRDISVKQFAKRLNEVWRDKYLPQLIGFQEKGLPQKEGRYATFASTNSEVEFREREHIANGVPSYPFEIACMQKVRHSIDIPKLYSEKNIHRALKNLSKQILNKMEILVLHAGYHLQQLPKDSEKFNELYAGFELSDIKAVNADAFNGPFGIVVWFEHKQPWCLCIDSSTTPTAP